MFRSIVGMILTLGFGLALAYFASVNDTLVPISLGLLLPGRQPQLHVWEIALFPAVAALVIAGFWSFGSGGNQKSAQLARALKETQNEVRAQRERLSALENQLRAGGFVPLAAPNAAPPVETLNDAADAPVPFSSAHG
jgi:hypothetical protein